MWRCRMIQRPEYLKFLIEFKDKELIKVVSGIRRCGKSTLFELFKDYLLANGVDKSQIISINFEDANFENLCDYKALYGYVQSKMIADTKNYIFLDEIQHVSNFEKAVDSLFIKKNADVYITGSNAYFMSGELATLLTGRYVELKMLPLSFAEYVEANSSKNVTKEELYRNYLTNSSFPYTASLDNKQTIRAYLDGIFNTVVLNDIVSRKKISDVPMLKSVIKFMFDNIGNPCSIKKIADTMTSMDRKISNDTVENYLDAMTECFLMYKVGRYDVKGKQYLQLLDKYYLTDIGLRYYLLGSSNTDQCHILENIVFLELLRRGNQIYVGKVGNNEVDFIVQNPVGETEYFQVSLSVRDENTLKRELEPLENIQDHNPKYLLTMDNDPPSSHNGIKQLYVLDWLLSKNFYNAY